MARALLDRLNHSRALKRAIDVGASASGLVVLSPLLVGAALRTYRAQGWPIFFTQRRPGREGKIFALIKFRTMNDARDARGELLPDAERLTEFGAWLRATSIDELPELWNVLRGEMSLVGPRPLLERYLPRYNDRQARRHEVAPGLTGWAQVQGRNAVAWEDRLEYDVWYVEHWSNWLDLMILLKTIKLVLAREGISEEGGATMTEFQGTQARTNGASA